MDQNGWDSLYAEFVAAVNEGDANRVKSVLTANDERHLPPFFRECFCVKCFVKEK